MYKLWLIHFDVQQKITQKYCKATILQKKFFKEEYLINGMGMVRPAGSQVSLVLRIQEPHCENHYLRSWQRVFLQKDLFKEH